MSRWLTMTVLVWLTCESISQAQRSPSSKISEPVLILREGPVNAAEIRIGEKLICVYGKSNEQIVVDQLLLTHHRRDLLDSAFEASKDPKTSILAPRVEQEQFEQPEKFWNGFVTGRFHDYQCQSTKRSFRPLRIQPVDSESRLQLHGLDFQVVDTPGFTRGAVSYITTIDNRKIAFTGDLIYGNGQLFDLYSLQDSFDNASIRGYHGYAARLAQLLASLRKIKALKPDVIFPARGPLIQNPSEAIDTLIARVQELYLNYLSTNALHWYFKADRMRQCAEAIHGGPVENLELMPYALHRKAPDWIFENATSRMLLSDSGTGFLIDCGYQRVIDAVDQQIKSGVVSKVEGIFVTHYHDDHTDMVQAAAEKYQCPVYCTEEYYEILSNPSAFQMPAMTDKPIRNIKALTDGYKMKWHEFDLTFFYFPGQAIYHGAMLAQKPGEEPVFFIGDSFAPSGLDDYCLLNRNLVSKDNGYFLCLHKLQSLSQPVWLMNEHISEVFRFGSAELAMLETKYQQRHDILAKLFPWDDPNYGIDERWAEFYPYGQTVKAGEKLKVTLRITNHSPKIRSFKVSLKSDASLQLKSDSAEVSIEPGKIGSADFELTAGDKLGSTIVTASLKSEDIDVRNWAEALVTIQR